MGLAELLLSRKVAADDHDLFMQQQTRNAEAYARKIKDVPGPHVSDGRNSTESEPACLRFAKLDTSGGLGKLGAKRRRHLGFHLRQVRG